jgi:hypothetical protein
MADNVTIPASGTGTATPVIATDDVGGAHFQKVKLDVGGDGASTQVIGSVPVSGNVAHDSVDSGNPVKIGGKVGPSTPPTAVAEGDRVDAWFSSEGQLFVATYGEWPVSIQQSIGLTAAITGNAAHDAVDGGNPIKISGYASAAMPTNVSADGDRVNAWFLRNGAQATVVTAAGALIGGDATNGLDVDVTRNPTSSTATLSNVGDSASSVTLLSSNANRLGATIHNDSTAILYVKFGTTASATSYTVKMVADAYYEVPFGFTGRIDGIWASDAGGSARITELT